MASSIALSSSGTTAPPEREPPPGPPWDLAPPEAPIVYIDLEMTGLDPEHDAIVEMAAIRTQGGAILEDFSSVVATERPSKPGALALHGLHAEALAGAPHFEQISARVTELLSGAVAVFHGAALDVTFLSVALASAGRDPSPLEFVLDTATLARRAISAPRYSLHDLSSSMGLPPRRWHRAREDAIGVMALFERLAPSFAAPTLRDLWEVRVGQRNAVRVRQSIQNKLAALAESHAICTIIARTPGRAPYNLRGIIERWIPPHAHIVPSNRRQKLQILRADRILRVAP